MWEIFTLEYKEQGLLTKLGSALPSLKHHCFVPQRAKKYASGEIPAEEQVLYKCSKATESDMSEQKMQKIFYIYISSKVAC